MLVHIHIRYLKDKTERVERVNIPIVAEFEHVVMEGNIVVGIGIVLQRGCLAVGLKIDIVLRKDLRQLAERVCFLAAVIEHKRDHILIQPALDIAEIHASVTGRKHTIEAFHHIALGLDINNPTLPRRIVFGRRIGDNFDFLNRVAIGTIKHGLELLSGEVGRLAIHPNLNGFTVYGNVSVFVNTHTRRTAEDIISVRTRRKGRSGDIHHQFVHLTFDKRFLGFYLDFFEFFGLFAKHEIRSAKRSLITDIRSLDDEI